mgnify:CR=1 FL=1
MPKKSNFIKGPLGWAKNEHKVLDNCSVTISLTQGKETIFSIVDFSTICDYRWFAAEWKGGYFHAEARCGELGKQSMSRFLMRPHRGYIVDHIDGNTLNNTRENLRICTTSQNGMNRRANKTTITNCKGVELTKELRYRARIRVNGTVIQLGTFGTLIEAKMQYDLAAQNYFGEFARGEE